MLKHVSCWHSAAASHLLELSGLDCYVVSCPAFHFINLINIAKKVAPALPGFSVHLQAGFSGFFKTSSARLFCTSPSRLLRFLQDQLCQAFLYISKQASPVSSRPALPGFSVHLQVGFSGFFKACSSLRLLRAFQRWTLSSPALRRKDFKDEITPNQVGLLVRIWNVSYHLGIVFEEEKHVKLITPFKW